MPLKLPIPTPPSAAKKPRPVPPPAHRRHRKPCQPAAPTQSPTQPPSR
jgi:hypothetical protein